MFTPMFTTSPDVTHWNRKGPWADAEGRLHAVSLAAALSGDGPLVSSIEGAPCAASDIDERCIPTLGGQPSRHCTSQEVAGVPGFRIVLAIVMGGPQDAVPRRADVDTGPRPSGLPWRDGHSDRLSLSLAMRLPERLRPEYHTLSLQSRVCTTL